MNFSLMLAPLEDTADTALRTLCHRYGADITFTEMSRIESLARKNASTLSKIKLLNDVPTWIQLAGSKESSLKKFLGTFEPASGFLGFNFNLGCPAPNIVATGLGCSMVKRITKVRKLVGVIRDYGYGASLKIRLGMNKFEKQKKVYLNLIDAVDADFFIVHARHGGEHYETPADFSVYEECVQQGKPIIANGDISTKERLEAVRAVGCQGAMIGRYAVYNPAIFAQLRGNPVPNAEQLREEYLQLAQRYPNSPKYTKNVLKRLGRQESVDKEKNELDQATMG